ncbi:MAG: hypothetical protein EOR60_03625 [Mesorhizobium sp.]|nr:MAG: hypothetical protein EOR60_03625 [Mesorhizobium sp.]
MSARAVVLRYPGCLGIKGRGEVTTSRINRRALLFHSGAAVFASTVAETGRAPEPPHQFRVPPNTLRALIEAHMTAYVGFVRAVHEMGGSSGDCDRASREEDKVLLAVCAYPAVGDGDRFAKARYLLEIEARGELDLPQYMQALLRSTMSKT